MGPAEGAGFAGVMQGYREQELAEHTPGMMAIRNHSRARTQGEPPDNEMNVS